jgi:hypothetical protein
MLPKVPRTLLELTAAMAAELGDAIICHGYDDAVQTFKSSPPDRRLLN